MDINHNMVMNCDWKQFPDDLLLLISEKLLKHIKDLIFFGSVCQNWRSVYLEKVLQVRNNRQLPMLMFPLLLNDNTKTHQLYDLGDTRVHNFVFPLSDYNRCSASLHGGWLVVTFKDYFKTNTNPHLINPFLVVDNDIPLPSFINDDFLRRVAISTNPTLSLNFCLMGTYDLCAYLAYYDSGTNNNWFYLDSIFNKVLDIIYFKDRFYCVNSAGAVWVVDVSSTPPKVSDIEPPKDNGAATGWYLVESSGDLLLIKSTYNDLELVHGFKIRFEVFKLDVIDRTWVEVESLDGRSIFIGNNASLSVLASDYTGCEPNCIYFTTEATSYISYIMVEGYDIGIFNLEDESIKPYHPTESKGKILAAGIWIEPAL